MNKIFLTQDGEVLRVQKRGQILLTLNAKENGNAAVAKRWEDVEDLRVTANIPNVSGIVRLPHTFDGSDMTIAAHYEWHDCNVMVIGNLGGVPFEFNIELKVDAAAAETTSAIVEVPALDAGGAGGSAGGGMVEVTHEQLKAMRDAGQLVAGQQYRITDYVATTTDPESRSANHPFDIIVTADNERTLSESARAIAHAGDTYFEKCNLAAWRLQYCIDNNIDRFFWAQQASDGYQIYVQDLGAYVTATLVSSEDTTYDGFPYRFVAKYSGQSIVIWSQALSGSGVLIYVSIAGSMALHADIAHAVTEEGKGVIYRMIDENNNDMPYDFKGIQFKRYKITACEKSPSLVGKYASITKSENIGIDVDDFRWAYLFNVMMDGLDEDDSVGFYLGIPRDCKQEFDPALPNGVCMQNADDSFSDSCYGWTCGNDCHSWTCGNDCYGWTCGNDCDSWTCGNDCYGWTCGDNCHSWTCGNYCPYWTCGNDCYSWTCGNDCDSWTCGNDCRWWYIQNSSCSYFRILEGVTGTSMKIINIPFVANANYQQVAGMKTDGTLRVWNPADV